MCPILAATGQISKEVSAVINSVWSNVTRCFLVSTAYKWSQMAYNEAKIVSCLLPLTILGQVDDLIGFVFVHVQVFGVNLWR